MLIMIYLKSKKKTEIKKEKKIFRKLDNTILALLIFFINNYF
jgi:hypothetical protein